MPIESAPTQSELEFKGLQPSDPYYLVKLLISEVQTDLAARKRHLLMVTSKWVIAYRFVRIFEDEVMLGDPGLGDRKFYQGAIGNLKGLGIILGEYLRRNNEVDVDPLGFTYQDFLAMVQDLTDTDRALHGDLTSEMAREIDARLFANEPATPA